VNGRQQFAQTYAELLAYAEAARSSGTETSPEFRDLMDLIRVRTLAEIHRRNLQARVGTPSQQDIDEYYRRSPADFTSIKLRRILIPRKNTAAQNQEEYEKHALEVVTGLRERAAKGEDFDQLQKEGFTSLGLTAPPATILGNRRKSNLLAEERDEILALDPGGVSKLEKEAFSFVIYKVEEKSLLAEDAVKDEISREISRQRLDNLLKEVTASVQSEFNQDYFSAPKPLPASQTPPGRQK
jgi:parvulin-like peptidyl-prolyl isomerase